MDWRDPSKAYNIVRDWDMAQGFGDPSDEIVYIRRDLDIRHISIENSGERLIAIAITTYPQGGPVPKPNFVLRGGGVKHVGVNTIGGPMQYIWMLDPVNGKCVGYPFPLRTDTNQFVLRDGLNLWWVQAFQSSGFKGW
jgi:hypothetical protein